MESPTVGVMGPVTERSGCRGLRPLILKSVGSQFRYFIIGERYFVDVPAVPGLREGKVVLGTHY